MENFLPPFPAFALPCLFYSVDVLDSNQCWYYSVITKPFLIINCRCRLARPWGRGSRGSEAGVNTVMSCVPWHLFITPSLLFWSTFASPSPSSYSDKRFASIKMKKKCLMLRRPLWFQKANIALTRDQLLTSLINIVVY